MKKTKLFFLLSYFLFQKQSELRKVKREKIRNKSTKQKTAPGKLGLFLFGADKGTRTPTVSHQILSLARLPIPPYPHGKRIAHLFFFVNCSCIVLNFFAKTRCVKGGRL